MKITCAQAHKMAFLGAPSQTVVLLDTKAGDALGWIHVQFEDREYVIDSSGHVVTTSPVSE